MQANITKIDYYSCGYCVNNLRLVFRGHGREKREFGAGVFLMRHRLHGYILFDTGYSTDIYNCGLVGRLYNMLNPAFVSPGDMIECQLRADNIDPSDIGYIILSHLHPDHIGGLGAFPNARILISQKAYDRYRNPGVRDLIIRKFVPDFFDRNLVVLSDGQLSEKTTEYFGAYDMFGDGSVLITNMDGHAYGQICALIEGRKFLAADTCWGLDLIDKMERMRFLPSKIQDNFEEYLRNGKVLARMRDNGIDLLFSHSKYNNKEIVI